MTPPLPRLLADLRAEAEYSKSIVDNDGNQVECYRGVQLTCEMAADRLEAVLAETANRWREIADDLIKHPPNGTGIGETVGVSISMKRCADEIDPKLQKESGK